MKNTVVIDASIAVKWVIDENDSDRAAALLARWFVEGATLLAPALLIYEVTNAVYQRVRNGIFDSDDARQALENVLLAELELVFPKNPTLSVRATELAQQYGLPATYDAHYLALAEREQCEYWTADTRLWSLVKDKLAWVRWFGDYQPNTL